MESYRYQNDTMVQLQNTITMTSYIDCDKKERDYVGNTVDLYVIAEKVRLST